MFNSYKSVKMFIYFHFVCLSFLNAIILVKAMSVTADSRRKPMLTKAGIQPMVLPSFANRVLLCHTHHFA